MNCLECQAGLQQSLDGEGPPCDEARERHCAECVDCRERNAAALRLLEGLKQLPRPTPAPGFAQALAQRIIRDRQRRREKMRRGVFVTTALAASILLLLLAGYYWIPIAPNVAPLPKAPMVQHQPKIDPPAAKKPEPTVPKRQDTRNTLASLSERWADTTRDHAWVVLAAADLDAVDQLPVMKELPPLEPGVREAGQEVSEGVRAVTKNAQRAFHFFARELPMPEVEAQRN